MTDATTTSIPTLVSGFDHDLDGLGTAARATYDQQYHKSEFAHMGVPTPDLRKLVKGMYKEIGGRRATHADITTLAAALWDTDIYERRLAAVFLLAQGVRQLTAADLQNLTLMLRDAPMWSLVDPISGDIAGKIALRDREGTAPTLDDWATDPDFWLRRAALLALIPGIREGKADLVRFTRYADPMLTEREFFIRKALGWVLREIAHKDPTWTTAWLTPRLHRLSGVTFREAIRRLPEEASTRLTADYKAAGGGRARPPADRPAAA